MPDVESDEHDEYFGERSRYDAYSEGYRKGTEEAVAKHADEVSSEIVSEMEDAGELDDDDFGAEANDETDSVDDAEGLDGLSDAVDEANAERFGKARELSEDERGLVLTGEIDTTRADLDEAVGNPPEVERLSHHLNELETRRAVSAVKALMIEQGSIVDDGAEVFP